MNTEKIELASVSKLIDLLSRLDYINPEIPTNDKSPSWDGFVNLYKEKDSCSKKDLERRIPVQVKGHYAKTPYQDSISFSADTSDLKNYLNECGVIFFVIYVDEDGNSQIYYSRLTRLILRRLIKGKENQETISIHLEKFPNEKKIATDIFFNFSVDMGLSLPKSDISIKDVIEGKLIGSGFNSFSLSYKGIQYKNDPWGGILNSKNALCLRNDITGIQIPIEYQYDLFIKNKEHESIYIDGVKYYESFERIRQTGDILILRFGKSFSFNLHISNDSISGKFNFKIQGNLQERINDTRFLLKLLETKTLTIGNISTKLPFKDEEIHATDIEYFNNNLRFLEKIKELLNKLHVTTYLDYDNVTENEEQILILLINTVLLGGKYNRPETETASIYRIAIANLVLMLIAEKVDNTSCYLYDFFDVRNKNLFSFKPFRENQHLIIPKSFILNKDDFEHIDNLNYETIISDIKKSTENTKLRECTYFYMQEMINGYRARTKPKTNLLCCIEQCIAFLQANVPDYNYSELINDRIS